MKCLNIIYNYDKIADLNKMKRIIQIKLSKINKKVLTNTNTNAIIMTSKEKRNKKNYSYGSGGTKRMGLFNRWDYGYSSSLSIQRPSENINFT